MRTIDCPHCRKPIDDDGSLAGWEVACPHCGSRFRMPLAPVVSSSIRRRRPPSIPISAGNVISLAILLATLIVISILIIDASREYRARRLMHEAQETIERLIPTPELID